MTTLSSRFRAVQILPLLAAFTVVGCNPFSSNELSGITPARNLTGTWSGSGTFRLHCGNPAWQWNGRLNPPSVYLLLTHSGDRVQGEIVLDIPESDTDLLIRNFFIVGLQTRLRIVDSKVSSSALSIVDERGQLWDFSFTTDLMKGSVDGQHTSTCDFLVSVDRSTGQPSQSISLMRE